MDEEVEHRIKMALAAIVGTVLTLMVSNWMPTQLKNSAGPVSGIGNLIASSAIGLIGGLTLKQYAPIWFAGTFAGMCAAAVIPQLWMGFVLGAFVFVIWWALEPLFAGVGGKFGFTAMLSGAVTAIFGALIIPNYNQTDVAGWPWVDLTRYADLEAWIWWFAPLFCALGAVATKWTRENIVIPLTNA
ncbi:MAG: hypothetical protein ACFFDN_15930, partial [Candidatus Hodarchaeota archaeon]